MKNVSLEIFHFCKKCEKNDIWTDKETGITFCYCNKGKTIYEHKKDCRKLHNYLVELLGL